MTVDSKNIFVGAPDQSTTGAILTGPATDTIPEFLEDFDDDGLKSSGYVSAEGVAITPSDSTESIRDWSGAEVRRLLTEFTGEISWTHLELSAEAAKNYFGDDQVDTKAATATTGNQMRASLGKNELGTKAWYFKIKDGDRRALVMVPHGTVSARGEIPLVAAGAITLPVTLACLADADGQSIYIFTDDGQVTSA